MKFKLLKANEDWKVERRHHDTENGEDYYYIWGPDGEYCDADGEPYHFDTKEDALEEVEYLKAEHKGNEKAKKVKSAADDEFGYVVYYEALEDGKVYEWGYLAEDGEWYDSLDKAEVLSKESAESFCKVNADAYSSNMEDNQEYRYTIFEVETVIRKIGKSGVYSTKDFK